MKKAVLGILIFCAVAGKAQMLTHGTSNPAYENKGRPLLVVGTGNEDFDDAMIDLFTKYWTLSSSQLVSSKSLGSYDLLNKYNYFTIFSLYPQYYNPVSKVEYYPQYYGYYSTIKDLDKVAYEDCYSRAPVNVGMPNLMEDVNYQLLQIKYFITGTICVMNFIEKAGITSNSVLVQLKLLKEFNEANAYKAKDKTLLVLEEYTKPIPGATKPFVPESKLKGYPFAYKIVSREAFYAIEAKHDPKYCFFQYTMCNGKYFMIYDVADDNPIYIYPTNTRVAKFESNLFKDVKKSAASHK
ncbi:MAG: hypothetical protein R2794_06580 [Chitinophagales bacterium]